MSDLSMLLTSPGLGNASTASKYGAAINAVDKLRATARLNLCRNDIKDWLIPELVRERIILRSQVAGKYGSFQVYSPGPRCQAIADGCDKVFMRPPQSILDRERRDRDRTAARMKELQESGIDLTNIPQHELDEGKGPTLNAELKWMRTLKSWRDNGKGPRAEKYEELLARIIAWRTDEAMTHGVSPVAILPDHVAKSVAYAMPTTADAIKAAGVRYAAGASRLAKLIDDAGVELCLSATFKRLGDAGSTIVLPDGDWTPAKAWTFAIFKPKRNGKKMNWEVSWDRFQNRHETVATIAMSQDSEKTIQQTTVVRHLLDALTFGRTVDLQRLHRDGLAVRPVPIGAPDTATWDMLEQALVTVQDEVDVVGADKYVAKLLAQACSGHIAKVAMIDYKDRTEDQSHLYAEWNNARMWWEALKRAGYNPAHAAGAPQTKRQRRQPLTSNVDPTELVS